MQPKSNYLESSSLSLATIHLAKAYRDCADQVRKQELKVLKRELSEDENKEVKGAM